MAFPTKIPLFRRFVLQNFPFIEQDFDALTDYQLICKVVEYLNKCIETVNASTEQIEVLTNAFNQLKDYVDHYFDNLDLQEEVNNKLDAMVEDGTLQEIIATYIQANVAWTFDTVADMKASTNLIDGSYAQTLGFQTINDGGSAVYKIRTKEPSEVPDENTVIALADSTLVAELNNNSEIIVTLKQPNTTSYVLGNGKTLTGTHAKPINAGDEDNVVLVEGPSVTIDDITISNPNNLAYKTGIKAFKSGGNTSSLTINDTAIQSGFEKGLLLDGAYFSSFNNVRIGNTSGASVTLDNTQDTWTGVQTFDSCVFHSGNPTVLLNKNDSNTIAFNNCCFEDVTNNVIENKGNMSFNDTYFGDMVTTHKETHILKGSANSKTYFNNCTLALNPALNTTGSFNSYFDLNNCKCYVNGGLIYAGNRQHQSAVYTSNNAKDLIYIDNLHHFEAVNWTPYYLYAYTPLRSINPMKNFVINGTLSDNLQNAIGFETSSNTYTWDISTNYVNPFGGKVLNHTHTASYFPYAFYFEVPDEYIGKEVKLQIFGYCKRGTGDNSVPFIVSSDKLTENAALTGTLSYQPFNPYANNAEFNERNVFGAEITVYPKAKRGKILIRYQDGGTGTISISGLALLDKKNSLQMGTFECPNKKASDHIPRNTEGATKGDFVYNFSDSATCEGWLFNGTSWTAINIY